MQSSLFTLIPEEIIPTITSLSTPKSLRSLLNYSLLNKETVNTEAFIIIKNKHCCDLVYSTFIDYLLICDIVDMSEEVNTKKFPFMICQKLNDMCKLLSIDETIVLVTILRNQQGQMLEIVPALLLKIAQLILTLPINQRKVLSPTSLTEGLVALKNPFTFYGEVYPRSPKLLDNVCEKLPNILAHASTTGLPSEDKIEICLLCQISTSKYLLERLNIIKELELVNK